MELVWFSIVWGMLAVYVVLDGFDFGVGIVHRLVAKTDSQRRQVLQTIGPVWDGNEVWLVAAGGVLFAAFPRFYAAAFSGFYMPLMLVLWLLILRGLSIELRSHFDNPLWREFWDSALSCASASMAIVLGVSLGNLIRGVPVERSGYFAIPLFTDFRTGERPGVVDWYTGLVGLFSMSVLARHGALYLVWKADGEVQTRSRQIARTASLLVLVLGGFATLGTVWLRMDLYQNLLHRPWTLILVLAMAGGFGGSFYCMRRQQDLPAFLGSCCFIAAILAATMAGNYPVLLRSTLNPEFSLTSMNAATGSHGLRVGLAWWSIGIILAALYFTCLFWSFRGKVSVEAPKSEH